ncbi:MAG: glycosyltransferase [Syntrophomonadaceae bacterium]
MESTRLKILMLTPYSSVQRGNSLTTSRLQHFLSGEDYHIDRLSLEDPNWQFELSENLSRCNYNLVHGFHARFMGQALDEVPALSAIPIILTTTGTDINCDLYSSYRNVVINALELSRKIVIFNDDFRLPLQQIRPNWASKLVTIPQGIYLETGPKPTRQEIGFRDGDCVFLLPSGLRPIKNIELAIDALHTLHQADPRVRLLIIGAVLDEHYAAAIRERIHGEDWLKYVGEVVHHDMLGLLDLGDVVLNTSHSEGQPQAALEAMSLGKPCILTAVLGNLNIIKDGQEGYYVRDKNELARAAHNLLDDPVLRQQMGQNARLLVEHNFSLNQELEAYRNLYRQTAAHP